LAGVVSVLALLVVLSVLAGTIVLVAASPSLLRLDEDLLEAVKVIVCGGLVVWVVLVGFFYALTRVLLWIEFADRVIYRCALGVRTLSWGEVVRIGACDQGKKKLQVTLVRRNGDRFSFSASRQEYEQVMAAWSRAGGRPSHRSVPLPWWTSLGIVALGTIVLALAAYVDYLWMTGEWTKSYVPMVRSARGRLFFGFLPFLLPVCGALLSGWGVVQLWKRRSKSTKASEEVQ